MTLFDVMAEPEIYRETVVVNLENGMHMYPCSQIARLVREKNCEVRIGRNEQTVNAKNVLDLMTLGAEKGSELVVETEGPDASETLQEVVALFASNFDVNHA